MFFLNWTPYLAELDKKHLESSEMHHHLPATCSQTDWVECRGKRPNKNRGKLMSGAPHASADLFEVFGWIGFRPYSNQIAEHSKNWLKQRCHKRLGTYWGFLGNLWGLHGKRLKIDGDRIANSLEASGNFWELLVPSSPIARPLLKASRFFSYSRRTVTLHCRHQRYSGSMVESAISNRPRQTLASSALWPFRGCQGTAFTRLTTRKVCPPCMQVQIRRKSPHNCEMLPWSITSKSPSGL